MAIVQGGGAACYTSPKNHPARAAINGAKIAKFIPVCNFGRTERGRFYFETALLTRKRQPP